MRLETYVMGNLWYASIYKNDLSVKVIGGFADRVSAERAGNEFIFNLLVLNK